MELRPIRFSIDEDIALCQSAPVSYPTRCAKIKGIVVAANRYSENRAPGVLDKSNTANSSVLII